MCDNLTSYETWECIRREVETLNFFISFMQFGSLIVFGGAFLMLIILLYRETTT